MQHHHRLPLPRKVTLPTSPNVAPATKSDTATSPNVAPATERKLAFAKKVRFDVRCHVNLADFLRCDL